MSYSWNPLLPPRGTTDWGARQFLRVLNEEERLAAEQAARMDPGLSPSDAVVAYGSDLTSNLIPVSGYDRLSTIGGVPVYPGYGQTRPFGSLGRWSPSDRAKLGAALGARTVVEALRAGVPATTSEEEQEPSAAYVPRYDGLGAEMAERRRIERDRVTGPEADLRHLYEASLRYGKPGSIAKTAETPQDTFFGSVADYLIGALEDVGFLNSKGDEETQANNDEIKKKIIEACARYGLIGVHVKGIAKTEQYYPHPDTGQLGSRRSDGQIWFNDGEAILDFNSARFQRRTPIPVKHEREAAAAIEMLQALYWSKEKPDAKTFMDTLPKTKYMDPDEWERRVDEQVDRLCRAIAGSLGLDVDGNGGD